MSKQTAPDWYNGTAPWDELNLAHQLYEALNRGPAHLAEVIERVGYSLGTPAERTAPAVMAVLEFAYHNTEDSELNAAVEWLVDRGYLLALGPATLDA